MNSRLDLLEHWLGDELGLENYTLVPASEDASFRRYFRICMDGENFIVMDAPTDREDCRPYIDIAGRLHKCGVNVPSIIDQNLDNGFLLIGDLGNKLYLDVLSVNNADSLYTDAISALVKMQSNAPVEGLPPYDAGLLREEMELFRFWLLGRHLNIEPGPRLQNALDGIFKFLADTALEQPRVFVHRDYHSRNLIISEAHNPGIIDFQDAVLGPLTYDLVSLFKDCYIKWPPTRVKRWVSEYVDTAGHLLEGVSAEQFQRWFDLMGVQRQLKASGIFARLWHRDQKRGFLNDIPRTLSYILDLDGDYPELEQLITLIRDEILTGLEKAQVP